MKTLSIITPCYNEELNVREVYERVRAAIASLGENYVYEHIFIDNASTDNTLGELKQLAAADKNVKVIRNTRNFGHIRSPHHALLQARGDAVISIVADLQDPPEMIVQMVRAWETGIPVVIGVKQSSDEHGLTAWIRGQYYRTVKRLSGIDTIDHFTGFGLYDRVVVEAIRAMGDPYPYFRGMIAELGYARLEIPYHQPGRKRGITANNFYTLYDIAMLGITNLSKVPLRIAVFAGFGGALLSTLVAMAYLCYKLIYWNEFSLGVAPLVIGGALFSSLQLLFLGILGEYVGSIHTMVLNRPFVVEQERINFDYAPSPVALSQPRAEQPKRWCAPRLAPQKIQLPGRLHYVCVPPLASSRRTWTVRFCLPW
jgi:glycosyltransferase involved in cell wall biosynthesis